MYDGKSAAEEIKILLNNSRKKANWKNEIEKLKLKNINNSGYENNNNYSRY